MKEFLSDTYKNICYILGTFFGIGCIKIAPGTFASIATALLWFSVPSNFFYHSLTNDIIYLRYFILIIGLVLFSFIAIPICTVCERKFGHDHKSIVIDEVVGYMFSVVFLPKTVMVTLYALILFRIFDISKPLLINNLQRLPEGWGVVCDDIAAGIYSNIILQILVRVKPEFFIFM